MIYKFGAACSHLVIDIYFNTVRLQGNVALVCPRVAGGEEGEYWGLIHNILGHTNFVFINFQPFEGGAMARSCAVSNPSL